MNWQLFGTIGYIGIASAVVAVVMWLLHWRRPLRWMPAAGLALAIVALVAARMNSTGHVARIAIDPAARIAQAKEIEEKKRQALLDNRNDEVAQIQFAEDGQGEQLDTAGMDEVDLEYLKAISDEDDEAPAWKQQKKQRGSSAKEDDSLEGMIGANEAEGGADVSAIEEAHAEAEPILMSEADMVLANRLDYWNLTAVKWLLWIAVAVMVLDYLRRANDYGQATWPLPLPSSVLEAFTPLASVRRRPAPRRDAMAELNWLTRRGDSWIYFTDKPEAATAIRESLAGLTRWPLRLDLIHLDDTLDDDFVFESLWYGRASFIVDSPARAGRLVDSIIKSLAKRRSTRARAPQAVHIVWDCGSAPADDTLAAFEHAARNSGVSFFILNPS